jgi:hypothetical protein
VKPHKDRNDSVFSSGEARLWLEMAIADPLPADIIGSIATTELSAHFTNEVQNLGISIQNRRFGLDASCVRHIWHDHGGVADKRRDQVPVTLDDLLQVPEIIATADLRIAPENKRTRGKVRIECLAIFANYKITIILEVRKRLIIPVTMWKKLT